MKRSDKLLTGAVIFSAVLLMSLHWRLSRVSDRVTDTERIVKPGPRTMTTTYVDDGGTTRTVTTTRISTETVDEWIERHGAAVKEKMEQYPPA